MPNPFRLWLDGEVMRGWWIKVEDFRSHQGRSFQCLGMDISDQVLLDGKG
jgi:hypothetical protein